MKHANIRVKDAFVSLLRLVRFVAWYAAAVALLFYLLPILGLLLEERYDMLSSSVKFFSVLGFFVVVAAWQLVDRRDRMRASIRENPRPGDFHSA
jgi:hypothetical protein